MDRTIAKLKSLSPSSLRTGFDIASRNSLAYVRDAKILYERGSRSHARGLTIMALEEFAKAILYYRARLGLNPVTLQEVRLLKRHKRVHKKGLEFDHDFKQRFGLVILFDSFFAGQMLELELGDKRVKGLVRRYETSLSKHLSGFATEQERPKCFYSEYDGDKWHDPQKVRFTEKQDIIPALEQAIYFYRRMARFPIGKLRKSVLRSMLNLINHYKQFQESGSIDQTLYGYLIEQFRQLWRVDPPLLLLGIDIADKMLINSEMSEAQRTELKHLKDAFSSLLNGKTVGDVFRGRPIKQEEYNQAIGFINACLE